MEVHFKDFKVYFKDLKDCCNINHNNCGYTAKTILL